MHILDTDTISHLHAGNINVVENLKKSDDSDIRITVITKIELLRGRFEFLLKASGKEELLRAQRLLDRTEKLLTQIPVLSMNEEAGSQFEIRSVNNAYNFNVLWNTCFDLLQR
jgi:tRNA(fMet)-specific endonuclease VapC